MKSRRLSASDSDIRVVVSGPGSESRSIRVASHADPALHATPTAPPPPARQVAQRRCLVSRGPGFEPGLFPDANNVPPLFARCDLDETRGPGPADICGFRPAAGICGRTGIVQPQPSYPGTILDCAALPRAGPTRWGGVGLELDVGVHGRRPGGDWGTRSPFTGSWQAMAIERPRPAARTWRSTRPRGAHGPRRHRTPPPVARNTLGYSSVHMQDILV